MMFLREWVQDTLHIGYKVDDLGLTLVNLLKIESKDDYFILTHNAKQVFYVQDNVDQR